MPPDKRIPCAFALAIANWQSLRVMDAAIHLTPCAALAVSLQAAWLLALLHFRFEAAVDILLIDVGHGDHDKRQEVNAWGRKYSYP